MKFCVGLFFLINFVNAAKILMVFPMAAHSHFTLGFRLAKELADRGHQVTFVSPYPQKTPIKNLKDVSVADIIGDVEEMKKELFQMGEMTYLGQLQWVANVGFLFTEKVINHKNVQNLLNSNEKFDLVINEQFSNDALMIIPHKLKAPFVLLAPGPTTVFNNHLFANPSPSSYVPNLLANFDSKMTFLERLKNAYYDAAGELFQQLIVIPKHNEILQKALPGSPHLRDIIYNASLMLLTSHVSINEPVPYQPNIKEIGGYHVSPPKALPKDIQAFLDSAKEGVVLFSMGSNLKSADFPEYKKKAVLKAFSKIKQKVLWKFEKDLPEKSDNVKIMKWLPQNDILAHPNVRAFISHGGLLGTIEAVYHGVPILGLSVFWDQEPNINAAARKGFALSLPFRDLDEESFSTALNEILSNPKYSQTAKQRSNIMHDQPVKQIDAAVYWIEYVIRHNGARHLRSAGLDLNWYQRNLLDIIAVLVGLNVVVFLVIYYILKRLLGRKSSNRQNTVNKSKKNK